MTGYTEVAPKLGSIQRLRAGRSGLHAVEDSPASTAGKSDGRAGVERKIAADREFGDAVNKRPRNPSQRQRIASRQIPGLLPGGDALLENGKGILSGSPVLFVPMRGLRQIEHYQEMLGPTQGKRHISATALLQPL